MDTHDRQRRILLYGILGTGCVLAAPVLLTACGRNEEEEMPPGPDKTGGESTQAPSPQTRPETGAAGGGTTTQGSGKMSQAHAEYQDTPNGYQQCSNCMQFVPENNTCKLVEGQISPQGWCILWIQRT